MTKIARASGLVDLYLKSVSVGKFFFSLYELAYPRRGSPSRICKVPDVTASEYRKKNPWLIQCRHKRYRQTERHGQF